MEKQRTQLNYCTKNAFIDSTVWESQLDLIVDHRNFGSKPYKKTFKLSDKTELVLTIEYTYKIQLELISWDKIKLQKCPENVVLEYAFISNSFGIARGTFKGNNGSLERALGIKTVKGFVEGCGAKIMLKIVESGVDNEAERGALPSESIGDYEKFYGDKVLSDVWFKVGDELIFAHQRIISAHCEALYKSVELHQSACFPLVTKIVEITDTEPVVFELLVRYIYCRQLDVHDVGVLVKLIALARRFPVRGLIHACGSRLAACLSVDNVFEVLKTADLMKLGFLKKKCLGFINSRKDDILMKALGVMENERKKDFFKCIVGSFVDPIDNLNSEVIKAIEQ